MTGNEIALVDLRQLTTITCQGRDLIDGQSVGNICGTTIRVERHERAPLLDRARAAGWRIGHRNDGTPDALCPRCARPDPATTAVLADLRRTLP